MKPNVLFIVIDSLRSDRFIGESRTCKTPCIDELLKIGTYFQKTYSSSDVTGICLGNMFTGNYSFKTGITLKNFNEIVELYNLALDENNQPILKYFFLNEEF